ncbi:MAG: hypothetical protein R2681_09825 [Pyrinomonadaceae bacterium]
MKRLSLKFIISLLTFFIGAVSTGLWYFSQFHPDRQRNLFDITSLTAPVKLNSENPCDFTVPIQRRLEPEEAVFLAECFIIKNGYTDLPPISDKSKLTPENLYPGTDEEGLRMRHDSLERKAYSYYRSNIYGGSWVVMFRYKPHPDVVEFYGDRLNDSGRAVIMDFFGNGIMVQHADYPLETPESKKLDQ